MERYGRVLEAKGDKALVLMKRHTACENCGRCGGILGGPDVKDSQVEVKNLVGAEQGQLVRVEIEDRTVLLMSFVVYMVPALALVIGLLLGYAAVDYYHLGFNQNLTSAFSGLALMLVTFVGLRLLDRKVKGNKNFIPVITSTRVSEEEISETEINKLIN